MDDVTYRLTAFDKDWTLDVKRNKYTNMLLLSINTRRHNNINIFL